MKINLTIIFSIIVAIGIVVFGFTIYQTYVERSDLEIELEKQTKFLADSYCKKVELDIQHKNKAALRKSMENIGDSYRLLGLAIYFGKDSFFTLNPKINQYLTHVSGYLTESLSSYNSQSEFIKSGGHKIFQYIKPLKFSAFSESAVVFYIDADHIEKAVHEIWSKKFTLWYLQALIFAWITIMLIRWGVFTFMKKLTDWMKAARHGNIDIVNQPILKQFLAPIHKEINQMAKEVHEAKATAEEEARLRATAESVWTPERLKEEVKKLLDTKTLIVVSNREPYMHVHSGKEIKCIVPASGLVTAMEPILKACGGLWVASGTGDADKETVDKHNKVKVPPESPAYTLKRIWLSKDDETHFYYGFSNEGIWPLCHIAHTRPIFRIDDWQYYEKVNNMFAQAVLEEIKNEEQPLVLVQDYHFALLPGMIKKKRPDAKVAIFWHIPWPNPESFNICPWRQEILRGMLGADLIGFHTQFHCNNFLETVNITLESRVEWQNFSVTIASHTTQVKPFPISIAFTSKDNEKNGTLKFSKNDILKNYGVKAKFMGVGVDRIDYTKGILERFLAVERFLEKYPSYQGEFSFIQVGAPSRTEIKSYSDIIAAVENEANRINSLYKLKDWKPIILLKTHHSHEEILPLYKASDLCMVTSLHDGMNLVAKEYVASRNTVDGVLILSRFAGAANELSDALIINPYDIEETADAIKVALEMTKEEQERRMKQMRQSIVDSNIYLWAANLIKSLVTISN